MRKKLSAFTLAFTGVLAITQPRFIHAQPVPQSPPSVVNSSTQPIDAALKTIVSQLAPSSKGNIVATVNGQNITQQELDVKLKPNLDRVQADLKTTITKAETQLIDVKRNVINQMVEEKLIQAEATKRGTTPQALLKTEVEDKVPNPTDAELQQIYQQNQQAFGGKPFEEVKPQLQLQIKSAKIRSERSKFVDKLMATANVEVYVKVPRVNVSVGNAPTKGPANAPVKIVEFTDYQCPFCSKVQPALKQIMDTYKDQVLVAVRNFPLDFHQQAKIAAVAALCAKEQGKYWEYADKVWGNQPQLKDPSSLKKWAAELGLNSAQFDSCLDQNKYLNDVMKDAQEGQQLGVNGTPAFFINGRLVSGALPFDSFKKIIDEELKEAKMR